MDPGNNKTDTNVYDSLKDQGNKKFKAKDYNGAISYYTRAIEAKGDEAAAFANRAACHLNLNNYYNVLSDCNKALELNSNFSKAYFRRARALYELSRFSLAKKDFERVIELEGVTEQITNQIKDLDHILTNNTRIDLKIFPKPTEFCSKKPMQTFELNNCFTGSKIYTLDKSLT